MTYRYDFQVDGLPPDGENVNLVWRLRSLDGNMHLQARSLISPGWLSVVIIDHKTGALERMPHISSLLLPLEDGKIRISR